MLCKSPTLCWLCKNLEKRYDYTVTGFRKQFWREHKKKSSNVNEVIRAVLTFLFIFFTKRFHTHKKHKNAYKQTKAKKTAFLCA